MVSVRFGAVAAVGLFTLVGCGGSSDSGRTAGFRLSVAWPERSRALNAPESAQSVLVTLSRAGRDGADVSATGNRLSQAGAHSTPIVSTQPVQPGRWFIDVKFYQGTNANGDLVATAGSEIQVASDGTVLNRDGTPLAGLNLNHAVTSVSIPANQTIPILQTRAVAVETRDRNGFLVGVAPAAIRYQVNVASGVFGLQNGLLRGLNIGGGDVVASVDGISSAPTLVTCTRPDSVVRTTMLGARAIAYDGANDLVLVACGPLVSGVQNAVALVSATTGSIVGNIPVGSEPLAIAVHKDGQRAYALVSGGTAVSVIDLGTRQVVGSFGLPNGLIGSNIEVSPIDSRLVAISETTGGIGLYRDGIRIPTTLNLSSLTFGRLMFNDAGSALYGVANSHLVRIVVGDPGLLSESRTPELVTGEVVGVAPGRVVLSNGQVRASESLALLNVVNPAVQPVRAVTVDPVASRLYVISGDTSLIPQGPTTVRVYDLASLEPLAEFGAGVYLPASFKFRQAGNGRLAVATAFTPRSDPGLSVINVPTIP